MSTNYDELAARAERGELGVKPGSVRRHSAGFGSEHPSVERAALVQAMEQLLVDFVGRCTCAAAFTDRGLEDPDCLWHNVNVRGEFPDTAADTVLDLLGEVGE